MQPHCRGAVLRHFSAIFAVVATVFAAETARAGDPFELDWRELDKGVFVGVRPVSYRSPVVGNTTIVIGRKGVLVFDAAGFALQGERLVAKVRELTDLPVTHIAISHWHDDHHLGDYKVLEAFPDAELISHEFTARAMASPLMGDIDGPDDADLAAQKEVIRAMVETGNRPTGEPLSDQAKAFYAETLQYYDLVNNDIKRAKISTPTKTVTGKLVIDLGGRKAELRHIAPGNTKGDLFLWLPKEKFLATGDIVVRPTPYGFYSYPKSWATVLREIKTYRAKTIVPGHGDIMTDTAYLDLLAETMDLVAREVDRLAAQGKTLDEVRAAMDFSSVEERFTHGDAIVTRIFDFWFKTPIVEAEYNLGTGKDNESLDAPAGAGE